MFVDRAEIEIEAGRGGNGCVAFRVKKYSPASGPMAEMVATGGSVIFRAPRGCEQLVNLDTERLASGGMWHSGQGSDRHGRKWGRHADRGSAWNRHFGLCSGMIIAT